MKVKKFISAVVALAVSIMCLAGFGGCKNKEVWPYQKLGENDYLTAEGELVKDCGGNTVFLRGVNAGGLFVTEHWMTGFSYGTKPNNDYKSLTKIFIDRFGAEKTKELWKEYRANWWTDTDFENCVNMGMNVIRLPFTYMNVDFDAITSYDNAGKNYDFSALDAFIERAAEYGLYTILDLHGAYGSQSGQDHSGEIKDYRAVDFYSNERMQSLTVKLWGALSEHYKDNPAVAGYDILNEPGERKGNGNDGVHSTEQRHWDFFDKVYEEIRENGDNHIIIFESCWNGENLPRPEVYGWENCMYSFHHYTSNTDTSADGELAHNLDWNNKISNVTSQNFGVPLQMGEFTSYSSPYKWEYTLGLLNRSNWHWVSWTYKVWGRMAWGIVNITADNSQKVDAYSDDYEVILGKFKNLRTDGAAAYKYTFYGRGEDGGKVEIGTLERLYSEYTDKEYVYKPEAGSYEIRYGVDNLPLIMKESGGKTLLATGGSGDKYTFSIIYHNSKDGSAYISAGGKYLSVSKSGGENFITAVGSLSNEARFYPVQTEYGTVFVSYSTCKYLRIDDEGRALAAADSFRAAVFVLE